MDHTDRFTGRQEDYQAGRPSYAQGLLDWLETLYTPPGAFARECRRILRPGGQVYLIWNIRTDAPVNQALAGLFRVHCPDFRGFSGGMAEDDPRIRAFLGGRYEKRRFPNPLTLDRDRFLRRCFSSSYSLREGDAGYPAYLAALEDLFGLFSQNGLLLQPNETLVYAGAPAVELPERSTY